MAENEDGFDWSGTIGAIGGGAGLIGGIYSPFVSNLATKKLSRRQFQRAQWMMRWGPSMQVAALKSAGLNPLLAMGGPSQNVSPQIGGRMAGFDPSGMAASARQAAESIQNLKNLREVGKNLKKTGEKIDEEKLATTRHGLARMAEGGAAHARAGESLTNAQLRQLEYDKEYWSAKARMEWDQQNQNVLYYRRGYDVVGEEFLDRLESIIDRVTPGSAKSKSETIYRDKRGKPTGSRTTEEQRNQRGR